ncbi:pilin N-terminal domain-containing protein [Enterococcus lactis]
MNGVTFAIYDVSDEFYKLRSEGSSIEDAQRKLAQKSDSEKILAESVTKTVDGERVLLLFVYRTKTSKVVTLFTDLRK